MKAKSGFTLVEILIVVVILGILAAIVIPQFTDASTQAKESSLCADLQTLRSQIELYKFKQGALPADMAAMVTAGYLQQAPVAPGTYSYSFNATTGAFLALDGTGTDTGW